MSPPKFTCGSVLIPSSQRGAGHAAFGLPPSWTLSHSGGLSCCLAVCECVREEECVCGAGTVSVECEQAEVGGFGSPMNALGRNVAELNARDASATALWASPAWCAGAVLSSAPAGRSPPAPVTAATAAAAAAPDAANYWRWSLERARESPSCRAGLRQALANQLAAQRALGLGRGQGAGGGAGRGGASRKLTRGRDPVVPQLAEPGRESEEARRAGQAGARGLSGVERRMCWRCGRASLGAVHLSCL